MPEQKRLLIVQTPVGVDRRRPTIRLVRVHLGGPQLLKSGPVFGEFLVAQVEDVPAHAHRPPRVPRSRRHRLAPNGVFGGAGAPGPDPLAQSLQRRVRPELGRVRRLRHRLRSEVIVNRHCRPAHVLVFGKVDLITLHAAQPLSGHRAATIQRDPVRSVEQRPHHRFPRRMLMPDARTCQPRMPPVECAVRDEPMRVALALSSNSTRP